MVMQNEGVRERRMSVPYFRSVKHGKTRREVLRVMIVTGWVLCINQKCSYAPRWSWLDRMRQGGPASSQSGKMSFDGICRRSSTILNIPRCHFTIIGLYGSRILSGICDLYQVKPMGERSQQVETIRRYRYNREKSKGPDEN